MFNAKRIETIRKNVQISTLLSDHEKSDWLNLLELMNDKQLGELEEILASDPNVAKAMQTQPSQSQSTQPQRDVQVSRPAQTTQSTPLSSSPSSWQPDFVQQMPPLPHIANMPTDVTMTHSVPSTPGVEQKPLPRTTPSPNLSTFKSKQNFIRPASQFSPQPVVEPVTENELVIGSEQPAPIQKTSPPQKPAKPQNSYSIQAVEQLQELSVKTIREHTLQSIFDVIRQAIQTNGYFAVLQLIEASPLYASYINAGKQRLGAVVPKTSDASLQESTLTQEEFEFMTDLLRNMRFNRW